MPRDARHRDLGSNAPNIIHSMSDIDTRLSKLREENSSRLARVERVNRKIDELVAVRTMLSTLGSQDSNVVEIARYEGALNSLIKANYCA